MASPSTPTHGKYAIIYRLRPNGFKGSGVNDLSWGTAAANAASALYEVVIDGVGAGAGGVDTFKWRKNGGAWTENVDITGAAQALDEGQTITFADDGTGTPHTLGDQWAWGNLVDEPTTEAGTTAQITDADKRILNLNRPPVFTDDGGKLVQAVNYTNGTAIFFGNVGNVTVDGNGGFIVRSSLEKVGYSKGWNFNTSVSMADATPTQTEWQEWKPGQASGDGTLNKMFIGSKSFLDALQAAAAGTEEYIVLELFNYDPDDDQTGDRFVVWATLSGINETASIGEIFAGQVSFKVQGQISFSANS